MPDRKSVPLVLMLLPLLVVYGCDAQPAAPDSDASVVEAPPAAATVVDRPDVERLVAKLEVAGSAEQFLANINQRLDEAGQSIAVLKAEYVTGRPGTEAVGQEILAADRELRLDTRWVPGDVRRNASGNLITQISSLPFAPANFDTPSQVSGIPHVNASFDTWNEVRCSGLRVATLPPTSDIPSVVLDFGEGDQDPLVADIVTIGFLPGAFFDLLAPDGSTFILGVTFTSFFTDGAGGPPTDIDGDGRLDTALKEVWYNDAFPWSVDGTPGAIDIETVALHENGHALELGHFGRIAVGLKNGKLHVSPRAVMNAAVLGTLRTPLGTDNAAFCGNFVNWPG